MKKRIWDFCTSIVACLPFVIIDNIVRICIYSFGKKRSKEGLIHLIGLNDFVSWNIDKNAIDIEHGVHPKHRLTNYHDFFCDRIESGASVLDAGCGYGAVSFSIAQKGAYVTGVDINNEAIVFGKNKFQHPLLELSCSDVFDIIPERTFDTVILSNILEHIDKRTSLLLLIQENYKPQRILLRVPLFSRDWLVPYKKELGLAYFSDPTHKIEYTVDDFLSEMQLAGLSVDEMIINWGEIWASTTTIKPN